MTYPWSGLPVEVAVFDMDGTLLNSGDFGVIAVTRAFESLIAAGRLPGLGNAPAAASIRAQIGKPPDVFYRALLPSSLQERAIELHQQTLAHEREFLKSGVGRLFDGALDVLHELKARRIKLALVSNCSRSYMDAVVEAFSLDALLDFRDCVGDKSLPGRDKSALVGNALDVLGVRRGVMVGDRFHDADAAKANGLWFIGCRYGYGEEHEFNGAAAMLDDIRQLPGLL
jgi:phosphoglycolate phosphatase